MLILIFSYLFTCYYNFFFISFLKYFGRPTKNIDTDKRIKFMKFRRIVKCLKYICNVNGCQAERQRKSERLCLKVVLVVWVWCQISQVSQTVKLYKTLKKYRTQYLLRVCVTNLVSKKYFFFVLIKIRSRVHFVSRPHLGNTLPLFPSLSPSLSLSLSLIYRIADCS